MKALGMICPILCNRQQALPGHVSHGKLQSGCVMLSCCCKGMALLTLQPWHVTNHISASCAALVTASACNKPTRVPPVLLTPQPLHVTNQHECILCCRPLWGKQAHSHQHQALLKPFQHQRYAWRASHSKLY